MAIPFYQKTSRMSPTIALDFSDQIATGLTLTSAVASAKKFKDGSNATSTLFPSSTTCTISGKVASIRVAGAGAVGTLYEIFILATLSDGQTLDGYARLMVDE